jgi:hypothetical protein
MPRSSSRTATVGIGGELLHVVGYHEPAFRCGASRFCTHGRVHGLPAVGREDAAGRTPRAAATLEVAGDGQERTWCRGREADTTVGKIYGEIRPEARRNARGRAPSSSPPAGEQLGLAKDQRVQALGCGGGGGMRWRRRNQPVGEETELQRRARQGWAARDRLLSGGAASLVKKRERCVSEREWETRRFRLIHGLIMHVLIYLIFRDLGPGANLLGK